jgi:3-oxoacyl-[acyl-carrier-protein] synthase-3
MVVHNRMEDHKVDTGDAIVFASVGAGMNINAFVYVV